jgi:hypothetical protein
MNLDTYMTKYLNLDPQLSPKNEENPSKFDWEPWDARFGQVWPRQARLTKSQARSGRAWPWAERARAR